MKPEKQRIAISEACGWEFCPSHDSSVSGNAVPECWKHENGKTAWVVSSLPDYTSDLNAMREAIVSLPEEMCCAFNSALMDQF